MPRTVLQSLSDKILVEMVKRGGFFHGDRPIKKKPQFEDIPDSVVLCDTMLRRLLSGLMKTDRLLPLSVLHMQNA
jgi:hypothetical protein